MNLRENNEPEAAENHLQHEAEHSKPHKKVSVLSYLTILFAAAFLLLLLSYFMQQRTNEQAISGLKDTSNSALQSIDNLIEEKDALAQQVNDLQNQLSEQKGLTAQKNTDASLLQEKVNAAQAQLQAMDWFWRIQRAFSRENYGDCRDLIAAFTASGLVPSLPDTALSGYDGPSPFQQYQEIVNLLN